MLRVALAEKTADGETKMRKIADALVQKAMDGDMRAIGEILDRIDGRPPMQVVDGEPGSHFTVTIAAEDARIG